MAEVTSQSSIRRSSARNLLDLDAGNGLPEVVQSFVSLLVLLAFAVMAALWVQSLVDTEGQSHSHPVSAILTVPALHASAPEYSAAPHRVTGPTAEDRSEQPFADSGTLATVFGQVVETTDSPGTEMKQDPIV